MDFQMSRPEKEKHWEKMAQEYVEDPSYHCWSILRSITCWKNWQVPLLIQLQQYGLLIDWKNYIFVMERQLLKMELLAIGILVQKCSKN